MSFLDVSGARIYFEVHGSGPPLLLIHGAYGTGDVFKDLIEPLSEHYTVVAYDRRGFTRSQLIGPQDFAHKLITDANDAKHLIEHLSDQPVTIFGSSSGAIVALEVLIRHPFLVRRLFPHEPPIMSLLPDGKKWLDFFSQVYDLYHKSGMEPALTKFKDQVLAESDRQPTRPVTGKDHAKANFTFWIENELLQYTSAQVEIDVLRMKNESIFPLVGRESFGYPSFEVSLHLAKELGRDMIRLPGGHNGYLTHPYEFAHEITDVLLSEDHI